MTTQIESIRVALADGPGTSGEISAETGLPIKHCSALLRELWMRGEATRSAEVLRTESCPRGAYVYTLVTRKAA